MAWLSTTESTSTWLWNCSWGDSESATISATIQSRPCLATNNLATVCTRRLLMHTLLLLLLLLRGTWGSLLSIFFCSQTKQTPDQACSHGWPWGALPHPQKFQETQFSRYHFTICIVTYASAPEKCALPPPPPKKNSLLPWVKNVAGCVCVFLQKQVKSGMAQCVSACLPASVSGSGRGGRDCSLYILACPKMLFLSENFLTKSASRKRIFTLKFRKKPGWTKQSKVVSECRLLFYACSMITDNSKWRSLIFPSKLKNSDISTQGF